MEEIHLDTCSKQQHAQSHQCTKDNESVWQTTDKKECE